jgi:alpha-glucosidase (family GH31 glycosyl hydrolase)
MRYHHPCRLSARGIVILLFGGVFTAFLPAASSRADVAGLGNVTDAQIGPGVATLSVGSDREIIRILSPSIIRIDYLRNGLSDPDTPMLDPAGNPKLDHTSTIDNNADAVDIKTARLHLVIHKSPCRLSLSDQRDNTLISEQPAGGFFIDSAAVDGGILLDHAPNQNFYGVAAAGLGGPPPAIMHTLLRDGQADKPVTYECNASFQGGAAAPLIWTTAGYGLLLDSDNGFFQVDSSHLEFRYGQPSQEHNGRRYPKKNSVTCFLLVGSPREILSDAIALTGKAPMFPRWAVGFTNSQWGITEHELLDILDTYRAHDIPIDNFTLDFDWKAWGQSNYGEFRWNGANFPSAALPPDDPHSLRSQIAARHVVLTGIMKPRIVRCAMAGQETPLTDQAADAERLGLWYPGIADHLEYLQPQHFTGELDFGNPATRAWYWHQISSHGAIAAGISGFWNDEADEAAVSDDPRFVAKKIRHFVFDDFQFMHMQQALYEGQRDQLTASQTPRMWSLNRNFYLGAQRYAYGLWSGDIRSGFDSMAAQAIRMLAAINVGEMRWGMDSGGFDGTPSPENYARWIQFSGFVPVFRVHGVIFQHRQPWRYGPVAEEIAKDAIRRRYQLAPYIYAADHEAAETGIGIVRPLMMQFPDDPGSADICDQWMFGDALLVAPVLKPLGNGKGKSTTRHLYLPPGKWIDYFRGETYTGPQTVDYPLNADSLADVPVFIRAGSVIVTTDVVPSIAAAKPNELYLDAFPTSAPASQMIYDDDGATYAYEKGNWSQQKVTTSDDGTTATLTIAAKTGPYSSTVKTYLARIHGRAAATVASNGSALHKADSPHALESMHTGWTVGIDVYGPMTIVKLPAGQTEEQVIRLTGSAASAQPDEELWGTSASHTATATTFTAKRHSAGRYLVAARFASDKPRNAPLAVYVNGNCQATLGNGDLWLTLAAGNNIVTFRDESPQAGPSDVDIVSLKIPFEPAAPPQ